MKTAMISDSISQIGQMAADLTCSREQLNNEINLLNKRIQRKENLWKMFSYSFGQINQKFFDNLHKLHPSLTPSETRMCAFILTGLTVKEIAILTNRSSRTIESIRYTLRKKLGINCPTESYMRYLSALSTEECDRLVKTSDQSHITCNPANTTPTNLD